MNFASVEKIANALLYEGYILYPYRPSAIKNRQRWNFGTLYPRVYAESQRPQEPYRFIAECLVQSGRGATLDIKLSFLQLLPQGPATPDSFHNPTDPSLDWDEAIERSSVHCNVGIVPRWVHHFKPTVDLHATLTITCETLPSGVSKLRFELENRSPLPSGANARRDEALPQSLVSAHLLLGVVNAEFISLLEPPDRFAADANACTNTGVFPVLAGEQPDRSIMLVSPIILYDYPVTAPESRGDFFDGTEMDEMLTLRVLTLTDVEKAEMRQGDPRARRILERTEAMTGDDMLQAHGVIRQMRELRDVRGDL
jgi:hypothetical protein